MKLGPIELPTYMQPIRQSSFCSWQRCRRYGFFRYRLCIHPNQQPRAKAAQLGRMAHALLEYGPGKEAEALQPFKDSLVAHEEAIGAGEDMFGDRVAAITESLQNMEKARVITRLFREKYPPSTTFRPLCKEQEIDLLIQLPSGVHLWLAGIIDTIYANFAAKNEYWVADYKTTSLDPDYFLTGYHFGPQKRLYRLLASKWLADNGHIPPKGIAGPRGFIVNVIRTPNIIMSAADRNFVIETRILKSGPRKGEPVEKKVYEGEPLFENYLERCRAWYADNGGEPIRSYSIPYSEPLFPPAFADALTEVQVWSAANLTKVSVQQAEAMYPEDQTTSYCKPFINNTCEYYPLCQKPCHAWGSIIQGAYTQSPPKLAVEDQEQSNDNLPIEAFMHPSDPNHPCKGSGTRDAGGSTSPIIIPFPGSNPGVPASRS